MSTVTSRPTDAAPAGDVPSDCTPVGNEALHSSSAPS